MAERERSADAGSEPDLRARIQARVAERRAGQAAEHGSSGASKPSEPSEPSGPSGIPGPAGASGAPAAAVSANGPAGADRPGTWVGRLTRTLGFLLAVAVTVVVLRSFVVTSYYIPSGSMEPTLHGCQNCQPDLVLVDKLSYRFSSVARSDVVVFDRPPLAPPEAPELIKRVIGLPGETVSGRNGRVFIGDKALAEPYVHPACGGTADFAAVKVPEDQYFVMGDNRCDSLDSRVFGVIAGSSIEGRAVAVSWPVKHLRWL
ncbi:MAG TPA: signal peptidase I [Jatrophihabitans sp.]|uniref:signal peptidase I n=1 Tax=Jatrophihabitans sp. TaxID=1932789 RepID=UPI002F1B1BC2